MSRRAASLCGLLLAALAAGYLLACQLLVDTSGLTNGHCSTGFKNCNNKCVPTNDPAHGCGSTDCVPCNLLNAYAGCDPQTLRCSFKGCVGDYKDCRGDAAVLGCPIDLDHDPNNCGACGFSCGDAATNGAPGCAGGVCAVKSCTPPYEDCDHRYGNGCETNLHTDPANCGTCARSCASGLCTGGVCAPADAGVD